MDIFLKNVIIAYPELFEPKNNKEYPESPAVYSARFLFGKNSENHKKVIDTMEKCAQDRWGAKWKLHFDDVMATKSTCLQDGDLKDLAGHSGKMYVSARLDPNNPTAIKSPLLLSPSRGVLSPSQIWSGCEVTAKVSIWAQPDKKRINCQLLAVQLVKQNPPLFGSSVSVDEFDDVETQDEDFDIN